MSEIEKMYENAGVEQNEGLEWVCKNPDHCTYQNLSIVPENCSKCEYFEREMRYPPFTAEKQVELIKWFVTNNAELETLEITYYLNDCFQISSCAKSSHFETNFENAIAGLINNLWQDLTEEEKQQMKGILE